MEILINGLDFREYKEYTAIEKKEEGKYTECLYQVGSDLILIVQETKGHIIYLTLSTSDEFSGRIGIKIGDNNRDGYGVRIVSDMVSSIRLLGTRCENIHTKDESMKIEDLNGIEGFEHTIFIRYKSKRSRY